MGKNSCEQQEFGEENVQVDKFNYFMCFKNDKLNFDLKKVSEIQSSTKCEFLLVLFSVYDPLGVISLIAIILEILFQKICVINYLKWSLLIDKNSGKSKSYKFFERRSIIKVLFEEGVFFINREICELQSFSDKSLKGHV